MAYKDIILADGPRLYYTMDGTGNPQDLSGNGFHGTNTGATAGSTALIREGGNSTRYADSTGSYTSIPANVINAPAALSVEFWAQKDVQSDQNSIFWFPSSNNDRVAQVHLGWSDGNIYWDSGQATATANSDWDRIAKQTSGDIDLLKPHHFVFTKDPAAGRMEIWVDGQLWHYGTGLTRSIGTSSGTALIAMDKGASVPYGGWVDEFAVYSKRLTQEQIIRHYQAGKVMAGATIRRQTLQLESPGKRGLSLIVPPGALSMDFDVMGAQGGSTQPTEGRGGRAQGVIPVTPGERLDVFIGTKGLPVAANQGQGGFNGGGNGGGHGTNPTYGPGAGGGGASDIRRVTQDLFFRTSLGSDWTFVNFGGASTPTINGNGEVSIYSTGDFWDAADTAGMISRPLGSNTIVEVTVPAKPSPSGYVRALQLRTGNQSNAAFYSIIFDGDNSHISTLWRSSVGATAAWGGDNIGVSIPTNQTYVLRISYNGTTATGYVSLNNGINWTPLPNPQNISGLNTVALASGNSNTIRFTNFYMYDRLVVAGGGGGHGSNSGTGQPSGAGGGTNGNNAGGALAAYGASQTAGGAQSGEASPGTFGMGGAGWANTSAGGGGGGGGYYGGGGSNAQSIGGSGGGGSGYLHPTAYNASMTTDHRAENGEVFVTFNFRGVYNLPIII